MIPLTLAEIAAITGGSVTPGGEAGPGAVVTGPVVIDSRRVTPGALFAALPGERADGHDFATAAAAAGATAVLASRPVPGELLPGLATSTESVSRPTLVASTARSRWPPASARPTSSSLVYGPYASAVSISVMPRSSARWMTEIEVASSRGVSMS